MLELRLQPHAQSDELSVVVPFCEAEEALPSDRLLRPAARTGLTREFAEPVLGALMAFTEAPAGQVVITAGAWTAVGSSPSLFGRLTRTAMRLALADPWPAREQLQRIVDDLAWRPPPE
ncbi:MAG: hypothetical protein GY913_30320 [Proteobacteria bacterium]|nr:hypothetical protein [Pseudomonadota bacterium]MCP4921214.1 hypothetical protein [Pseudomonadota bacterium]